jgi:hypothetical protein
MNKIKTTICLIAFVFVSAASAEQYIEVRTMREVKQVFTHYASHTLLLSATTQSVKNFGFYRLTVSPAGDVTQIRVMRPAVETTNAVGLHEIDIIMLHTLVLWKANPSTTTRIVDVKLRRFSER